jgi:hypothetical protein
MRYYELDTNGKVKGSYAVPQPDKEFHLLEDAPDNESKRDGVPGTAWIPDQDIIDARLAEEARIVAKHQAFIDNLPSWTAVDTAINNITSLADAKAFIKKLARVVYWDIKGTVD